MDLTSAKIFIEAYALYVLSGSLLLNFILLRSVVVQRYKFALEKIKIKIAFIDLEYKKDENERIKFLQKEVETIKEQLKRVRGQRNTIIFGIVFFVLFAWFVSVKDKLFSLFKNDKKASKSEASDEKIDIVEQIVKETEISSDTSVDSLLEQIDQLELKEVIINKVK